MSKQPEALRVADWLEHHAPMLTLERPMEAAADVRRLHSLNAELVDALTQIASIEDQPFGLDWEEIAEARKIANKAIAKAEAQQ